MIFLFVVGATTDRKPHISTLVEMKSNLVPTLARLYLLCRCDTTSNITRGQVDEYLGYAPVYTCGLAQLHLTGCSMLEEDDCSFVMQQPGVGWKLDAF